MLTNETITWWFYGVVFMAVLVLLFRSRGGGVALVLLLVSASAAFGQAITPVGPSAVVYGGGDLYGALIWNEPVLSGGRHWRPQVSYLSAETVVVVALVESGSDWLGQFTMTATGGDANPAGGESKIVRLRVPKAANFLEVDNGGVTHRVYMTSSNFPYEYVAKESPVVNVSDLFLSSYVFSGDWPDSEEPAVYEHVWADDGNHWDLPTRGGVQVFAVIQPDNTPGLPTTFPSTSPTTSPAPTSAPASTAPAVAELDALKALIPSEGSSDPGEDAAFIVGAIAAGHLDGPWLDGSGSSPTITFGSVSFTVGSSTLWAGCNLKAMVNKMVSGVAQVKYWFGAYWESFRWIVTGTILYVVLSRVIRKVLAALGIVNARDFELPGQEE